MVLTDEIVFYAFRYACGRMTYATHDVSEFLISHWYELSPDTREMIVREIGEKIDRGEAGMDCDIESWQKVVDFDKANNH